ncbi:MAG: hypothetical protein GXY38_07000 [Planctomycetes bacterium]|nr:hypothetical protein [Planctomycetota bacterium]
MAESEEQLANEIVSGDGGSTPKAKLLVTGLLVLGVVGICAAGGFFVGSTLKQTAATSAAEQPEETDKPQTGQAFVYIDLDPVIATLNTPNRERTAMAVFTLLVEPGDAETLKAAMAQKKPEINSRVLRYLSARTLEEVSGELNMNRVARELQDLLNDIMWPAQRGLVQRVEYKNFNIQ